jgi:hypothetical protein
MSEIDKYRAIDEAEAILVDLPRVECPLVHRFTPGLYIREIFMPAGTMLTSKIHNTTHPFVVSKGRVNVIVDGRLEHIEAPYTGITTPGTRRVIYTITDVIWTTFHPLPYITGEENNLSEDEIKKITDSIEAEIIEAHDNPLLDEETKIKYNLKQKICHSLE